MRERYYASDKQVIKLIFLMFLCDNVDKYVSMTKAVWIGTTVYVELLCEFVDYKL